MKIVLVHNSYQQPGGEDLVFDHECRLLENHGHQVIAYRRSNHEIDELSSIEKAMLLKRSIWANDTHHGFSQLLARENPDVVHVHNTFLMISPSIYGACRDRGVPVVQTLHNFRLLCPSATFFRDGKVCEECVDRSLLRSVRYGCYRDSRPATASLALMLAWHRHADTWNQMVDCYVALTEFARNKFIASGFPGNRIVVKPNFVDPDPRADHHGCDYAIFVGRLSPEKGLNVLIDAWARLPKGYSLHIAGDGPERNRLERRVRERNVAGVKFLGRLGHDDTIAALKAAKCLVLPSLCYEGFPMCIAEAFACGVPVICSRLGGMQEIVEDGRTGLLFEPGNAADLAKQIEWVWSHPSDLCVMGLEARREYEERYTAEKNYAQLMGIYEQAVAAYA
ncbi:MAG: glycosyltransferase family 4 protein [Candidatus Acidiferrales bacterium]